MFFEPGFFTRIEGSLWAAIALLLCPKAIELVDIVDIYKTASASSDEHPQPIA